ncbi:hypothetical protein TUMSATVNIG1_47320 [Vibrio nigripulchritudo]|uniref:DUF2164 domain-containing protein n=1 Tax=Vibrio nigripulchritudo SOn1 TaxID=1238450 RepID=A0AAV2VT21_9VIBR|nr:DUF2164 domain-containing protein [Vibrio nigripulchritudo]BCL72762.1 hypothetical protein VNTUMSATTG_46990 [Vibrio nigripulchritudo]BDU34123.1 hypothetical protein TUMSATVNIG1_47320 [Vibrio nigripulchritudo]CCO47851.1 conserved hypothetical protein [Vibrio nigripulchritudo SOn1]
MTDIKIERDKKNELVEELQRYLIDELDTEIGQFEAEFLLDFFVEKAGPAIYNQALTDARAVIERKVADIDDELYGIEK